MGSKNSEIKRKFIGIEQIMKMIPHRYPFLMIDRVGEIVPKQSAVGTKNVTINESYFKKMILLEDDSDINVAFDGERLQPVYCLIKKSLLGSLEKFLDSGERKIDKWFELCSVNTINFENNKDLFININNKEDLNKYKEKIKDILNKDE